MSEQIGRLLRALFLPTALSFGPVGLVLVTEAVNVEIIFALFLATSSFGFYRLMLILNK